MNTGNHALAVRLGVTFLTDRQVAQRYNVGRTTVWRWVLTDPAFPKPVALSPGCTRWNLSALVAWEAAKAEA